MSLFVDSSMWYAAADIGDRSNDRAREALASGEPLITSDHVLIESWLLLRRRLGRSAAHAYWDGVQRVAAVESVGPADLQAARTIRDRYADQDFSVVDLTSFAVMHRLGLERVATFDSDFAVYRFGPRGRRAFVVLR